MVATTVVRTTVTRARARRRTKTANAPEMMTCVTRSVATPRATTSARATIPRAFAHAIERYDGADERVKRTYESCVASGAFAREVVADVRRARARLERASGSETTETRAASVEIVRTIASTRSEGKIEEICARAKEFCAQKNVSGLLCVSGDGDGARMTTSTDALRALRAMRAKGEIPREVKLFAAVNPMGGAREAVRAVEKREAGAEGFFTQPALLSGAFDEWRSAIERTGAFDGADVSCHIGVACVRSAKNFDFWLKLCGVERAANAEARAAFDEYVAREKEMSPEIFNAWAFERVELATMHAISMPFCDGVHVMPVTVGGYAFAETLASDVLKRFLTKKP